MIEVEVPREVPKRGDILSHDRPGIRTTVRLRVEALAREEVVLDELQVRIEAKSLVVDVALPGMVRSVQA